MGMTCMSCETVVVKTCSVVEGKLHVSQHVAPTIVVLIPAKYEEVHSVPTIIYLRTYVLRMVYIHLNLNELSLMIRPGAFRYLLSSAERGSDDETERPTHSLPTWNTT